MHFLTSIIFVNIKQYAKLSANIAYISICLTTSRPIIQKLTKESISIEKEVRLVKAWKFHSDDNFNYLSFIH